MRSPRDISSACRRPGASVCGKGITMISRCLLKPSFNYIEREPAPQNLRSENARARILVPDQQRQSGKAKLSRRIVNDVYLAGVETWRELSQRHIQLEDGGVPLGGVQLITFDHGSFVSFGVASEESDIRHQAHWFCTFSLICAGDAYRRGIINFIIEVQVLIGGKYVGNAGDDLLSIVHQRVVARALAPWLNLAGQHNGAHL